MLLLLAVLASATLQSTDTTVTVRAGSRLDLDSFEGDITVSTWNRNAVRIQATHDDDTRVEIEARAGGLSVRGRSRHGTAEISFRVTVPADLSLELNAHEGEVRIDGSRGEVQVSAVEGAITLTGGRGRISLQSVEGDITVTGAEGRISLSTVDGAIVVRDATGDLQVNTVDGEIMLDGIDAANVEATTVDGAVTLNGILREGGRYQLSSHDGDVTVQAPVINAAVSISTFSGGFESDFPVTLTGRTSRKRMDFTLGTGSARLELQSFDGTVALRKGSGRSGRP